MRPDTWPMFLNPAIWGFLFEGLRETIYIALATLAVSFPVGLLFALGRLSRRRWIRWPSTFYIEGVRALPVLLLIVYFGIKGSALFRPIFGEDFELPRFWAGVLGLSMYTSAVLAEIIRAGIVSLPRGQTEAARAMRSRLDSRSRSPMGASRTNAPGSRTQSRRSRSRTSGWRASPIERASTRACARPPGRGARCPGS